MPAHDTSSHQDENERERDGDRSAERHDKSERGEKGSKGKQAAQAKSKDLSHVPCKFFKVGGCTAGASCPFSHAVAEPGAQKETCTWFVKGNCKFGHKCALAHILPGQPMSMDRKNKKAAQQAAQQAAASTAGQRGNGTSPVPPSGSGGGEKGAKRPKRDHEKTSMLGPRTTLLGGGSTAPTRALGPSSAGGRLPMNKSLQAAISPSAPAPPVKDIDFASLEGLDETDRLASAPAQGKTIGGMASSPGSENRKFGEDGMASKEGKNGVGDDRLVNDQSPSPLPVSAPRNPPPPTKAVDYGPIGSPPVASGLHRARSPNGINGVSIAMASSPSQRATNISGTPNNTTTGFLSSSPFSAPGTKSTFMSYNESGMRSGMPGMPGIAVSLGPGLILGGTDRRPWMGGTPGSEAGGGLVGLGNQMANHGLSSSVHGHGHSNSIGGRTAGLKNNHHHGDVFAFEDEDVPAHRWPKGVEKEDEIGIGIEHDDDGVGGGGRRIGGDDDGNAVAEGDMEDFIPGSLTDLLTPEERSRRMSRSNSGQAPGAIGVGLTSVAVAIGGDNAGGIPGSLGATGGMGHRYSRSVPATSIIGELNKSIWSDGVGTTAAPANSGLAALHHQQHHLHQIGDEDLGVGSLGATGGGGVGSLGAGGVAGSPSFSMLSPSNASAAFLPGFHAHYSKAKQQQQQQQAAMGLGGGGGARSVAGRNVGGSLYSGGRTTGTGGGGGAGGLLGNGGGVGGVAMSPPPLPPSNPFDLTQNPLHNPAHPGHAAAAAAFRRMNVVSPSQTGSSHSGSGTNSSSTTAPTTPAVTTGTGNNSSIATTSTAGATTGTTTRPIPSGITSHNPNPNHSILLSPGARALQSHAPGQSLPQGLAAGYSRIHALPPPPNPASPGSIGTGGVGVGGTSGIVIGFGVTPPKSTTGLVYGGLDWAGSGASPGMNHSLHQHQHQHQQNQNHNGAAGEMGMGMGTGLETMFSRLSYSTATARAGNANSSASTGPSGVGAGAGGPPGLQRGVGMGGMGRYAHHAPNQHGHGHAHLGTLSPLSGPVVTRHDDDDDLFRMDK